MYRMLIVDDTKTECDCVQFLLDEYRLPIRSDTARDGCEALELLRCNHYDILFTDIRMPRCDGLRLSQEAFILQPHLRTIIFSGHHDFAYAKQAIKLGVTDYLLKPLNPEEFETVLLQVLEDIKLSQRRQMQFRKHILQQLVNNVGPESLQKKHPQMLEFLNCSGLVVLVELKDTFLSSLTIDFEEYLHSVLTREFVYLNTNPAQGILLFSSPLAEAEPLAQSMVSGILRDLGQACYTAFADNILWEHVGEAYRELDDLLQLRFFYPDTYVFYRGIHPKVSTASQSVPLELIEADIANRDYPALTLHLELLFHSLRDSTQYSVLYVKHIFISIVHQLMAVSDVDAERPLQETIEQLYAIHNLDVLIEIVWEIVRSAEKAFSSATPPEGRINQIRDYIDQHYNQDLNLEELSKLIYVHPDYLCRIFKKDTGITINKYIKGLRMKEAQNLLNTTHMKVTDIGREVGYANPSYFIQTFREQFGVSPDKFRQKGV